MTKKWILEDLMTIVRSYQPACVIFAAADLDVFTLLSAKATTAKTLAAKMRTNAGATACLLNALAAMKLLGKQGDEYRVPAAVAELLTENGKRSVLPMVLHQANCLRRWVQLAEVTKSGKPAKRSPSIRGKAADEAAFIGAMDNVSGPITAQVVSNLKCLKFHNLLDIGGASGTWAIAFLRAFPCITATLFDLPEVIPMARNRLRAAGMSKRVSFVGGDFYKDDLPEGADFAWLSAIAHQNSRKQNRQLFSKIHKALNKGGVLVIRDIVMDESHISPQAGALFAINMLVATEGGGTFTFREFKEDLSAAGFSKITLMRKEEGMTSLIRADKC
jgi:predicted O-methyltransferase YrrM